MCDSAAVVGVQMGFCCRDRPRPVDGGDRAAVEQRAPLTVADLYSFNRVRFRLRSQKSLYISG